MKLAMACCGLLLTGAVSGCAQTTGPPPPRDRPTNVGNGIGSQFGNYAAKRDGEMRSPTGELCSIFNWDRPVMPGFALRVRSASCDSKENPGRMEAMELSRTLIPISESNLKVEEDE
jgi:hypothetical protein